MYQDDGGKIIFTLVRDFSYSLFRATSVFQKSAFLCERKLSGVTCLTSSIMTPTRRMQRMLTTVRVRLTRPLRNNSRGMSSSSAYSNLKSCSRAVEYRDWLSRSHRGVRGGVGLTLKEGVLEGEAHEGHGPVEAGVDGRGEERGGDGDPHHGARVAAQDGDGDPHPTRHRHRQSHHQAAPARPARHLHRGPVLAGGDGQQAPRPVELHHEQTPEQEAAGNADEEAVELPLDSNPEELPVPDGHTEHYGQDGSHQRGHQHGGHQDDAGVLHQTHEGEAGGDHQETEEVEGEVSPGLDPEVNTVTPGTSCEPVTCLLMTSVTISLDLMLL